jgi:hypothetical protein
VLILGILLSTLLSNSLNQYSSLSVKDTASTPYRRNITSSSSSAKQPFLSHCLPRKIPQIYHLVFISLYISTVIFCHSKFVSLAFTSEPGGPCSCIYEPPVTAWHSYPPGTGSPFHLLIGLAGLLRRYSNPPLQGVIGNIVLYILIFTLLDRAGIA